MRQRINSRKPKTLTREQAERRQAQAIRFAYDVLNDSDLGDELSDLSVEEYAERRGFRMENSRRRGGEPTMPSKRELEEERDALLSELEDIRDSLDDVLEQYEAEDEQEEEPDDAQE